MSQLKADLRKAALSRRASVANRSVLSSRILRRLRDLPIFQSGATVLWYVSVRTEVETRSTIREMLSAGQSAVVPYCHEDRLRLCRLMEDGDLARGRYGIDEPTATIRERPDRRVDIASIDVVIVPGVAFDASGTRLGHGQGYYDKLLADVRPDTRLVALAFDCQLFPRLPCEPHDIKLHQVVTETRVIECERAGRGP
jgi:5-formyltetrahydrofolate cyclo-ligase